MDQTVLVSPIGFRPGMILPLVKVLRPDAVELLAGRHPMVVEAEKAVVAQLKREGIPCRVHHVGDDWDIQSWTDHLNAVLEKLKADRPTLNVTAGHGLAVSMVAVEAARRSLPLICFDWEAYEKPGSDREDLQRYTYLHSPAAILNFEATNTIDRKILAHLLRGPSSVNDVVQAVGAAQSTVSTSLARLLAGGFVDKVEQGRSRLYSIRPGLQPMLKGALKRPSIG